MLWVWPVLCDIQVSVLPVEINQESRDQSVRGATHYDITMGNDVNRDIYCDVTMSNEIAMCTYHNITMHNDVAMMSQWGMKLLCVHIMALECIMMLLWTSFIMYYYAYLCYFIMGSVEYKHEQVSFSSVWGEHISCFCVGIFHESEGYVIIDL